jgi:hypothetical protein
MVKMDGSMEGTDTVDFSAISMLRYTDFFSHCISLIHGMRLLLAKTIGSTF